MPFTRCPHCQTTFRITAEALEQARGQVRCGRCTRVFDATAALSERLPVPRAREDEGGRADDGAAETAPGSADGAAAPEPAAAQSRGSAAPARGARVPFMSDEWRVDEDEGAGRRSTAWGVAAALAALVLGGQVVHHFRADLAGHRLIGGIVQNAYAALGIALVPHWDLSQYRIVDWVASARSAPNGAGSLAIRAELENRGATPQPYPHIHLELKDRWDAVVASRVFEPEEYTRAARPSAMMRPRSTAVAELEVVDPGPDAYGFELDVCVRTDSGGLRCADDDVFQ